MNFRPATIDDAFSLAQLGARTFIAAFGHLYRAEDLHAFVSQVHTPVAVAQEIAGESCRHQLAELDGELVAYCKLRHPSNYVTHSSARNPIELGQLYALPQHTGAGIGARMMDWTLEQAHSGGHDAILLSVYSENFGAQRFYQRYGFAKIADITFQVGEQHDPEFLYELRIGES